MAAGAADISLFVLVGLAGGRPSAGLEGFIGSDRTGDQGSAAMETLGGTASDARQLGHRGAQMAVGPSAGRRHPLSECL